MTTKLYDSIRERFEKFQNIHTDYLSEYGRGYKYALMDCMQLIQELEQKKED